MNTDNLKKLCNYLAGNLHAAFDMHRYDDGRVMSYNIAREGTEVTHCGTIGCAVGHGPFAGIEKRVGESWREYSMRVFEINPEEHLFLFSGAWGDHKNTPEHTVKRIQYFIENGTPVDWGNNYMWEPPTKQEVKERIVYKSVLIDSTVKAMTEKELCKM